MTKAITLAFDNLTLILLLSLILLTNVTTMITNTTTQLILIKENKT